MINVCEIGNSVKNRIIALYTSCPSINLFEEFEAAKIINSFLLQIHSDTEFSLSPVRHNFCIKIKSKYIYPEVLQALLNIDCYVEIFSPTDLTNQGDVNA
jgi:hypothetical protein